MNKRKIINDPIYGLITFPFDNLYELIEHPYFQRLRRISQMGLSTYVYPGANHSRFSHAMGALHLMTTAITILREKGIDISDEEYLGVCQAILLHDIGHGPFSHGLEEIIYPRHHEKISLDLMQELDKEFGGGLALGIAIFEGKYHRPFLHELVSSQLDMDRMDYLTRDSYYTGVAEGVIGYKRLISMMNVVDEHIVVEEKAIFSIEKFLVARHFMYWQVYLHKTSIVAERMLREAILRIIELINSNELGETSDLGLVSFLKGRLNGTINDNNYLASFTYLDDIDVMACLKSFINHPDPILSHLSQRLLNRKLNKLILRKSPIPSDLIQDIRHKVINTIENSPSHSRLTTKMIDKLIYLGEESNQAYNNYKENIQVLRKDGAVVPISEVLETLINVKKITKFYLCYPIN